MILFIGAMLFEFLQSQKHQMDQSLLESNKIAFGHNPFAQKYTVSQNMQRALIHGFSYFMGQALMMIFMLYNGFFCVSLVSGRAMGYFLSEMYANDCVYDISVTSSERVKNSCCS